MSVGALEYWFCAVLMFGAFGLFLRRLSREVYDIVFFAGALLALVGSLLWAGTVTGDPILWAIAANIFAVVVAVASGVVLLHAFCCARAGRESS